MLPRWSVGARRWRGLALDPRQGQLQPAREPGVFLGYRVSRAGVSASKRLRRRLKGRIQNACCRDGSALARCLDAYRGILIFP